MSLVYWSDSMLEIVTNNYHSGKLNDAIAIAKAIPETSPVYQQAHVQTAETKSTATRQPISTTPRQPTRAATRQPTRTAPAKPSSAWKVEIR